MAITLDQAKAHLNIVDDDRDNDLIERLIEASTAHLEAELGFVIEEEYEGGNAALDQAALMLVAHWFENREASLVGISAQSVPMGVQEIVNGHRNWSWE